MTQLAYLQQQMTIYQQAKISITDSDQGIPEESIRKIFELLFTTKSPGENSGLGLNIVKKSLESVPVRAP